MQSVALIDYGSGNLRSAQKALIRAADGRADIVVTNDPAVVAAADRIVLPGVGAFAACMAALAERQGVIEAMNHATRSRRTVPGDLCRTAADGVARSRVRCDAGSGLDRW